MDFETARRVLLVASLEETDDAGDVVPHALRRKAGDGAPELGDTGAGEEAFTPEEEAFLSGRADTILNETGLDRGERRRAGRGSGWLLVIAGLAVGFFSKDLGSSGVVNILAFPLLGLMLWNVAIYVFGGVRMAVGKPARATVLRVPFLRSREGEGSAFLRHWLKVLAPAEVARFSIWLHLGAVALAVGAVGAMYYQGLIRDYQATWASTFLSPEQVRGLLSVALAPATWFPGLALPDVEGIRAIRAPGEETAAAWIHRYALAAALVVVVPRLLLALVAAGRAKRMEQTLPVRSAAPAYFKTLLAEKRGVKSVVRVVPHRLELASKERDALRGQLHEHWGGALWMDFLEPVAYGDEEEFSARAGELVSSDHVAVVCGLAATPEDESQGRLLRAVSVAAGKGDVLLVLDDGGFSERFGDDRATERRAAWEKLAGECGIELL